MSRSTSCAAATELDLGHGQVRLEDEPVGPAVDDAVAVVLHLEPGNRAAVVEAGPEVDARPDRSRARTEAAEQLTLAALVVVIAHCEAVDEHQRAVVAVANRVSSTLVDGRYARITVYGSAGATRK